MIKSKKIKKIIKFELQSIYILYSSCIIQTVFKEESKMDFEKVKAKISPKTFSKENIVYNRTRYNNSTEFYRIYYGERIDLLVDTIKRYKQLKGYHRNDELYLADLLK